MFRRWFWQYGRKIGHRVALYPQSRHRQKELYGEFLINAQGEDVVAGIRTPRPIKQLAKQCRSLSNLAKIAQILEKHFRDTQDLEFTVEEGKFYILQTRTGKRTPEAAVKIAHDMVLEKLISKKRPLCALTLNKLINCFTVGLTPTPAFRLPKGWRPPRRCQRRGGFDADKAESEGNLVIR